MLTSMTSLKRAFASCNGHSFATLRSNLVKLVRFQNSSETARESRRRWCQGALGFRAVRVPTFARSSRVRTASAHKRVRPQPFQELVPR
jgi:hypothetical protein